MFSTFHCTAVLQNKQVAWLLTIDRYDSSQPPARYYCIGTELWQTLSDIDMKSGQYSVRIAAPSFIHSPTSDSCSLSLSLSYCVGWNNCHMQFFHWRDTAPTWSRIITRCHAIWPRDLHVVFCMHTQINSWLCLSPVVRLCSCVYSNRRSATAAVADVHCALASEYVCNLWFVQLAIVCGIFVTIALLLFPSSSSLPHTHTHTPPALLQLLHIFWWHRQPQIPHQWRHF